MQDWKQPVSRLELARLRGQLKAPKRAATYRKRQAQYEAREELRVQREIVQYIQRFVL